MEETSMTLEESMQSFRIRKRKNSLNSNYSTTQQKRAKLSLAKEGKKKAAKKAERNKAYLKRVACKKASAKDESFVLRIGVPLDVFNTRNDEHLEILKMQLSSFESAFFKRVGNQPATAEKVVQQTFDLKGEIRVIARIRPTSKSQCVEVINSKTLVISNAAGKSKSSRRNMISKYNLDHVFKPTCSQENVFEEVKDLIESTLKGFRACIFAYGQTGSGKTYTMEGPPDAVDEQLGLAPRSVQYIFKVADKMGRYGWKFQMEFSSVEIYLGKLRDLTIEEEQEPGLKLATRCKLVEDKNGRILVQNSVIHKVATPENVIALIRKAKQNRRTAVTYKNERSSRSHAVYILNVNGVNEKSGQKSNGVLNLIDLAGNEKFGQGNLIQDKNKSETIKINESLTYLGNVFMALARNEEFIPYRSSLLARLLRNSLGKNSKTVVIVNMSAEEENIDATINSLRFALKINQVISNEK